MTFKKRFDEMDDWEQHFLVALPGSDQMRQIMDADGEDHTYEVFVTINGVEVDFQNWINTMRMNLDYLASDKASEMITAKFNELHNALDEVGDAIEQAERKVRTELNVPVSDW